MNVIMEVLTNKLLPSICEKFPKDTKVILLQMDNSTRNINGTEMECIEAVNKTFVPIVLSKQTAC